MYTRIQYMVHRAHPSPQPKRHLGWFSRFCRAHDRDRQTDRPKDKRRYIGNSRLHLLRRGLIIATTSGQSNLTKGRIVAAHGLSVRQVAPVCTLMYTRASLAHMGVHNLNGISIGSAVFAQLTAERPYTLQRAALSPLKIASSHGGSGPSNALFLGPIPAHNPSGISIGSAVFPGLKTATDRPTDRPFYSVCNNRPHLQPSSE